MVKSQQLTFERNSLSLLYYCHESSCYWKYKGKNSKQKSDLYYSNRLRHLAEFLLPFWDFKDWLVPKGKVREYEGWSQLPTANQMIHEGLQEWWPLMISAAHIS